MESSESVGKRENGVFAESDPIRTQIAYRQNMTLVTQHPPYRPRVLPLSGLLWVLQR